MLFDLRSAGRRRMVKAVYLGLALLMFMGFVFFGIGSSGLGGSIGDLFSNNSGGGDSAAKDRLVAQVQSAKVKAADTPTDAAAWSALALARVRLAGLSVTTDASGNSDFTADGKAQLKAAGDAWNKYIGLTPAKPDESLARQMVSAFVSLGDNDGAVGAQEIVTQADPTQQTFSNLAILAYQANQIRKGDLAAKKAISLAPKADQKDLKGSLDQAKSTATLQNLQGAAPTATPTL